MTPDLADGAALRRERYGTRAPALNEWTIGDIARGWLLGIGALLVGCLIVGIVLLGAAAPLAVLYGTAVGAMALTVYGVPVAIAAAAALRRVRAEWVHLVVFGTLGALGGLGTGSLGAAVAERGAEHLFVGPSIVLGTAVAVLARSGAKAWAIRARG